VRYMADDPDVREKKGDLGSEKKNGGTSIRHLFTAEIMFPKEQRTNSRRRRGTVGRTKGVEWA